jgi:hypothetical protein
MTHPGGGSGGTGPSGGAGTGPGRTVTPLTAEQRADNYRRQTGTDRLTPRQQRRIRHKARGGGRTNPQPTYPTPVPVPSPRPGTPPPPR